MHRIRTCADERYYHVLICLKARPIDHSKHVKHHSHGATRFKPLSTALRCKHTTSNATMQWIYAMHLRFVSNARNLCKLYDLCQECKEVLMQFIRAWFRMQRNAAANRKLVLHLALNLFTCYTYLLTYLQMQLNWIRDESSRFEMHGLHAICATYIWIRIQGCISQFKQTWFGMLQGDMQYNWVPLYD